MSLVNRSRGLGLPRVGHGMRPKNIDTFSRQTWRVLSCRFLEPLETMRAQRTRLSKQEPPHDRGDGQSIPTTSGYGSEVSLSPRSSLEEKRYIRGRTS